MSDQCPDCERPLSGRTSCRCGWSETGETRVIRYCEWGAGCGAEYKLQIAGQRLCTAHYLAYQDSHPYTKPATILAAEAYFERHTEFHRRHGEGKGEYMRRLRDLRPGGGVGSAYKAQAGGVGMAQGDVLRGGDIHAGLAEGDRRQGFGPDDDR